VDINLKKGFLDRITGLTGGLWNVGGNTKHGVFMEF
jgi:hypothetical protein